MDDADIVLTDAAPAYVRPVGMGTLGSNSHFAEPYTIRSPHRIHVGRDVWFGRGASLSVVEEYRGIRYEPTLTIGDRCIVGPDLWLHCAGGIDIGADVVITPRVYIGDSFRDYENPHEIVGEMPIPDPEPIRIRDGAFLGAGSAVLPGVTIGERAIVSAGSVVTRDVPARTVVFGNPARVVRSWDEESGQWVTGPIRR